MKFRKIFTLCIANCLSLMSILTQSTASADIALPEIVGGWQVDNAQIAITPLESTTGNLGRWTRCVYKRADGQLVSLEVNVMEGTGPGKLRVPEHEQDYRHDRGDERVGFFDGDEYKTLIIAGRKAILERHSLLPLALAVAVSSDVTITFEGKGFENGEDELVAFAKNFITCLVGE